MKRQTRSDKSLGKEGNGNEKEKTPDIVATSENENSTPDGKDSGKKESEKEKHAQKEDSQIVNFFIFPFPFSFSFSSSSFPLFHFQISNFKFQIYFCFINFQVGKKQRQTRSNIEDFESEVDEEDSLHENDSKKKGSEKKASDNDGGAVEIEKIGMSKEQSTPESTKTTNVGFNLNSTSPMLTNPVVRQPWKVR